MALNITEYSSDWTACSTSAKSNISANRFFRTALTAVFRHRAMTPSRVTYVPAVQ